MSRLRILEVLEATEGGTRTHFRDLVLGLDPERFEVDVAVGLGRDPSFVDDLDAFRAVGVKVHIGPMIRSLRPWADAKALRWLRGVIRGGRYDVVHGHSSKAGFLARAAAHIERVPASLYTPNAFRFQAPDATSLECRLALVLERLAARWGKLIIAVSDGERQAALDHRVCRPERIITIPNGVDVEALAAASQSDDGRQMLGVDRSCWLVLTVGRRVAQKGDRFLLDAWPAVVRQRPDAMLVLVGDGPWQDVLQTQARNLGVAGSVRFVPRQPRVAPLYAAANCYVLPSLYEGCPYSLLEAMALGRPCVATAVEGSRDVITDGVTGLLVQPAEPRPLGEALVKLARNPELADELGRNAAAYIRQRHTVKQMVAATAEVYTRLAAGEF